MSLVLDYASPKIPRRLNRLLAALPSIAAVVSAVLIFNWSTRLAAHAQMSLIVPTWCATGRHDAEYELYYFVPCFLAFPIGGWIGAHFAKTAVVLARCSTWASILAWAVSTLFVVYR